MPKKNTASRMPKVLGAALLLLLIAALSFVYVTFREKAVSGSKAITIQVVDSAAKTESYSLKTDAEFLLQAMEEAEGLTFSGSEGPYGMMITEVNGERAVYEENGAYWSFTVNGEYCNYGASEQPVEDGDSFVIAYTK